MLCSYYLGECRQPGHRDASRMGAAGQVPKRVRLGVKRVGCVEEEVLAWLKERLDRRDRAQRHSRKGGGGATAPPHYTGPPSYRQSAKWHTEF